MAKPLRTKDKAFSSGDSLESIAAAMSEQLQKKERKVKGKSVGDTVTGSTFLIRTYFTGAYNILQGRTSLLGFVRMLTFKRMMLNYLVIC